jgi:hypothetical protein
MADTQPPSGAGSYDLVLQDLRARRDKLDVLIRSLEDMVRSEGITGAVMGAGGAQDADQPERVFDSLMAKVRPGEFHNLSYPSAAKAILAKTQRHPLTTHQILEIIEKSGRRVEGQNPSGTIYTSLTRNPDFTKVKKNTWGLSEWYPGAKRPAGNSRRASEPDLLAGDRPAE